MISINDLFNKNAKLTNSVILFIGLVLIACGVLLREKIPNESIILISIGASIVASAIVVYVSAKYLVKRQNVLELIEKWGLIGIFNTRSEMNRRADKTFVKLENKLDIVGFGFRAFRSVKGSEIEEKVKRGLQVRILTMNPESSIVKQRENDEHEVPGQIKNTIKDLIDWVESLKNNSPNNLVQIKFYDNLPLQSYYRQDNHIYTGPYLFGKPSQQTISFEYKNNSLGFNYWASYFESVWNNSDFAKENYIECSNMFCEN